MPLYHYLHISDVEKSYSDAAANCQYRKPLYSFDHTPSYLRFETKRVGRVRFCRLAWLHVQIFVQCFIADEPLVFSRLILMTLMVLTDKFRMIFRMKQQIWKISHSLDLMVHKVFLGRRCIRYLSIGLHFLATQRSTSIKVLTLPVLQQL